MIRWKRWTTGVACVALIVGGLTGVAEGVGAKGPSTGPGSCTLNGWNPNTDPANAKSLPVGKRPQSYKPDDFNCSGAQFAPLGAEFQKFPQAHDFKINNTQVYVPSAGGRPASLVQKPAAAVNPLSPYFPPFQHFVVIYRENHTFDDYLGDCATTVASGCNGQVQSTNHISSVPNLHNLAKTYALSDAYSTGTQPPSGPNHWWMFSAQSQSSSQQQSYPSTGTQFDRFLMNTNGPTDEGTNACTAPTGTGSGSSPYTFVMNGDFYWMLSSGSGYWKNPADGKVEVLPPNRPGTSIPEELHYNEYTCANQSLPDSTISNDYINFVNTNGLPAYSYVELFNDHPGTYQDIPGNDTATNNVVNAIENNASYKNNTLIIVTEDDTQNGSNGADHVSNTYRVPLVVIGPSQYVKQHYLSHVAYSTNNVIAAMERTMENVKSGIIDPNDNIGQTTFPMTTNDQAALGDPLEDFWVQGATPLSASASASPTTGNAPLSVNFTGSAQGGTAPYTYSWNFGDGSATSTSQNPSHTYSTVGTYTATLTVTDSASPANTATSTVSVTADPVGSVPPSAPQNLTAAGGTNQVTLNWQAPSSTGGQTLTKYSVYRGTSSGTESLLTSGGCSGLSGTTLTCTDTGLTAGTTYYYRVTASNPTGESGQSNEVSATPTGGSGCTAGQLLGNTGFENGPSNTAPWTVTSTHSPVDVINSSSSEPPRSGTYDAWLDGWGASTTDTLSQTVTLPSGCTSEKLNFYMHIDTAETTTTTKYDTLKVQVLNSAGTVLGTLYTYSNLNANSGYSLHSLSLLSYAGQTVTLKFTGTEDSLYQTSFVIDDATVNVS